MEEDARPAGFIISRDCRSEDAGIYIKRILMAHKDRGLGQAALQAFLESAHEEYGPEDVWLIVRNENARAQAVYTKHGFVPFDPSGQDAARFDAIAEAPAERCFRMRRVAR